MIDTDVPSNRRDYAIKILEETYPGHVARVCTFSTATARSALQIACKGLGLDNDYSLYLSSLFTSDRGALRTITQTMYGDPEQDMQPNAKFAAEMRERPDVLEVALGVEGLIKGLSQHAGGVILTSDPLSNYFSLMKTNQGTTVTSLDLHMAEAVGAIKQDILSTDALTRIRTCLDLLVSYGYVEWKGNLRDTYENAIGVYNLERDDPAMWEKVWNGEVSNLFQMTMASGVDSIALTKPSCIEDLISINSAMRLAATDKNAERPIVKFARFKANRQEWINEMTAYGLTPEEQKIMEKYLKHSYGMLIDQDSMMLMVQDEAIAGWSLATSDRLRRSVSKKQLSEFLEMEQDFVANAKEKNLSVALTNYVWFNQIYGIRSYGFNFGAAA